MIVTNDDTAEKELPMFVFLYIEENFGLGVFVDKTILKVIMLMMIRLI